VQVTDDRPTAGNASTIRRGLIRTIIALVALGVLLFASAGDILWPGAWAYMAILVVSTILPLCGPFRFDQGLIEERMSKKPDAEQWDRVFKILVGVFTAIELVVPGLDHRWAWTQAVPTWAFRLGLTMVTLGTAGLTWAMHVNRFFSAVVRFQRDRGHHVVTDGPYRVVRHPGYAAWAVRTLGVPLLLESWWAFIPATLFVMAFVLRTAKEDEFLQQKLPGYAEYAARVRSRLVPGLW
jgi:protein-S-isoprenylcysteine O-methyltransferase Ste14